MPVQNTIDPNPPALYRKLAAGDKFDIARQTMAVGGPKKRFSAPQIRFAPPKQQSRNVQLGFPALKQPAQRTKLEFPRSCFDIGSAHYSNRWLQNLFRGFHKSGRVFQRSDDQLRKPLEAARERCLKLL